MAARPECLTTKIDFPLAASAKIPPPLLPNTGFVRLPTVLVFIPVSRSCWLKGVKDGLYPPAVRISKHSIAWRAEDIKALIDKLGAV